MIRFSFIALCGLVLLFGGCNGTVKVFPDQGAISEAHVYWGDDLFRLLGDEAERYYDCNFIQMVMRVYRRQSCIAVAEVFEFKFDADALKAYRSMAPGQGQSFIGQTSTRVSQPGRLTGYFVTGRFLCRVTVVPVAGPDVSRSLLQELSEHLYRECPKVKGFN